MGIKFYNKALALATSGTFLFSLCGCSNNNDTNHTSVTAVVSDDYTIPSSVTTTLVTTTIVTFNSTTVSTSSTTVSTSSTTVPTMVTTVPTSTSVSSTYSSADMVILDHFDKLNSNIENNMSLESCKAYFIYCVDFLFYDGEINGIKFSDLSDSVKQQLLIDISNIDSLISAKYPDYKETIGTGVGSAYDKAFLIIKDGSQDLSNFSSDKLGEENYDKIKEYKDLFIEQAFYDWDDFVDILGLGKQKVKSWYESYRGGQNQSFFLVYKLENFGLFYSYCYGKIVFVVNFQQP